MMTKLIILTLFVVCSTFVSGCIVPDNQLQATNKRNDQQGQQIILPTISYQAQKNLPSLFIKCDPYKILCMKFLGDFEILHEQFSGQINMSLVLTQDNYFQTTIPQIQLKNIDIPYRISDKILTKNPADTDGSKYCNISPSWIVLDAKQSVVTQSCGGEKTFETLQKILQQITQ